MLIKLSENSNMIILNVKFLYKFNFHQDFMVSKANMKYTLVSDGMMENLRNFMSDI
jgi:hypothetical protein